MHNQIQFLSDVFGVTEDKNRRLCFNEARTFGVRPLRGGCRAVASQNLANSECSSMRGASFLALARFACCSPISPCGVATA